MNEQSRATTFAGRLEQAIKQRGLSQAGLARLCGVSQQSISYIIKSGLKSSKLAPKIASVLHVNPEWLMYGRGKFEETRVYNLPVINSFKMLEQFLNRELDDTLAEHIITQTDFGRRAFAYLIEPKKLIICAVGDNAIQSNEYLSFNEGNASISTEKTEKSFAIFEWRIRYEDF